jgi:hypothetical protein
VFIVSHPSCFVVVSFIFIVELKFFSACLTPTTAFSRHGFHFIYACPFVFFAGGTCTALWPYEPSVTV